MQNRRNGSSLIKVYAPVYTCIYLCHATERRTLNELLATSWPRREQLAALVVHSTVNVGNVHTIQTFISLFLSLSLSLSPPLLLVRRTAAIHISQVKPS